MPPPDVSKQKAATEITIVVDQQRYVLRANEISALDAMALRNETGISVRALLQSAQDDPDIDVIAGLVWLARRQAGETKLTFATVAEHLTYDADLEIGEGAEPDPESDSAGG